MATTRTTYTKFKGRLLRASAPPKSVQARKESKTQLISPLDPISRHGRPRMAPSSRYRSRMTQLAPISGHHNLERTIRNSLIRQGRIRFHRLRQYILGSMKTLEALRRSCIRRMLTLTRFSRVRHFLTPRKRDSASWRFSRRV